MTKQTAGGGTSNQYVDSVERSEEVTFADWSSFAVAGATLILAFLTWRAVEASRDAVKTAKNQADIERESLQASIQPWLANTTLSQLSNYDVLVKDDGSSIRVSLGIRNVGVGIALITEPTLTTGGTSDYVVLAKGATRQAAIPPQGTTVVEYSLNRDENTPDLSRMDAEVGYTDIKGRESVTAIFHLRLEGPWNLDAISYVDSDGELISFLEIG